MGQKADAWTLTVRRRGRTDKERYETGGQAIAGLQRALDDLARTERRETARALVREIEPVAQVAARLELAGPDGERGGVDLRGDGSAEAYTGRWRRVVVERRGGEDAATALRRALGA